MSAKGTAAAMVVSAVVWLGSLVLVPGGGVSAAAGPSAPEPPALLADTGLFADGDRAWPGPGVQAFAPQYPLWTDGLVKRRWLALPAGATIDAADPFAWDFPVGTKLWKEFALGDRPVETRFLWRATATTWVAAAYEWDATGTMATLVPASGVRGVVEVAPGRRHDIPSRADCATCHGPTDRLRVLGVNALQLSPDRDPGALHADPLRPGLATVTTLAAEGRFGPQPPPWTAAPMRIPADRPETRAVLGYLAANCGMCHDGTPAIAGFDASLAMRDVAMDPAAVVAGLRDTPTRWQAPGLPEGETVLVRPGDASTSALFLRMRSRAPSTKMAPLGSVVADKRALAAVTHWIDVTLAPAH